MQPTQHAASSCTRVDRRSPSTSRAYTFSARQRRRCRELLAVLAYTRRKRRVHPTVQRRCTLAAAHLWEAVRRPCMVIKRQCTRVDVHHITVAAPLLHTTRPAAVRLAVVLGTRLVRTRRLERKQRCADAVMSFTVMQWMTLADRTHRVALLKHLITIRTRRRHLHPPLIIRARSSRWRVRSRPVSQDRHRAAVIRNMVVCNQVTWRHQWLVDRDRP